MRLLSPTHCPYRTAPWLYVSEEKTFSSGYSLKSLPGIVLETTFHCGQNLHTFGKMMNFLFFLKNKMSTQTPTRWKGSKIRIFIADLQLSSKPLWVTYSLILSNYDTFLQHEMLWPEVIYLWEKKKMGLDFLKWDDEWPRFSVFTQQQANGHSVNYFITQSALSNPPGSPDYKPWDIGTLTTSMIKLVFWTNLVWKQWAEERNPVAKQLLVKGWCLGT